MLPQFRAHALALACIASSCASAAATAGDLAACAAMEDDSARLACYDALAVPGRRSATTPDAQVVAPTSVDASPVQATDGAGRAASPAGGSAQDAEDEFGLSEADKRARDPDQDAARRRTSISGTVTRATRDPYDRLVVTLDNGQVWVQNEGRSGIYLRPGETVTITQGSLGGYALRSERYGKVRVRRVK